MPLRVARPKGGEHRKGPRNGKRRYSYRLRIPFGALTLGDFELRSPFKLPFLIDVGTGDHPNRDGLMTVQDFFAYIE